MATPNLRAMLFSKVLPVMTVTVPSRNTAPPMLNSQVVMACVWQVYEQEDNMISFF